MNHLRTVLRIWSALLFILAIQIVTRPISAQMFKYNQGLSNIKVDFLNLTNHPGAKRTRVTITSDPSDAEVYIAEMLAGRTPLTTVVPAKGKWPYTLKFDDLDERSSLYKPFKGELDVEGKKAAISVWLDRYSAEEAARLESVRQPEACRVQTRLFPLVLEAWSWRIGYGYATVEGQVTNRSNKTMENLLAHVEFYTADGTFISSSEAIVDYTSLLPGQSTPFEVLEIENPLMETAEISFTNFSGDFISSIAREKSCN